jgi:hypothetical protein
MENEATISHLVSFLRVVISSCISLVKERNARRKRVAFEKTITYFDVKCALLLLDYNLLGDRLDNSDSEIESVYEWDYDSSQQDIKDSRGLSNEFIASDDEDF